MTMDAERWLAHFRRNREARPEPVWDAPITLAPHVVRRLVRSLEQFHLGDGGGPAGLIAWNKESFRSRDETTRELVDLWFDEEKEHSRLLCGAVQRFGGQPITGHWSFSVFCAVRRWLGVRFELMVLLLTEIVSNVYYRMLYRHGDDPALRTMARLIIRDEVGHIAFHRDRRAREARRGSASFGRLWAAGFRLLGLAAATMLWINHASGLKALGTKRSEYYREVWGDLGIFLKQLRHEADAYHELPANQMVAPTQIEPLRP
jgi:hypothetical protein